MFQNRLQCDRMFQNRVEDFGSVEHLRSFHNLIEHSEAKNSLTMPSKVPRTNSSKISMINEILSSYLKSMNMNRDRSTSFIVIYSCSHLYLSIKKIVHQKVKNGVFQRQLNGSQINSGGGFCLPARQKKWILEIFIFFME